jgi:hypothetical protein
MTDFDIDSASSQLRVIRSLMERATIYRSLSAPTAFAGGLLSFGGLGLAYMEDGVGGGGHQLSDAGFLAIWLTILVLASLTNAYFLRQEARRRGHPLFSAGMKCALRSVLPPFLCAGFFTILCQIPVLLASAWILFYGLGLLAMQHFAPRSIVVLGWMFVAAAGIVPSLAMWALPEWAAEMDRAVMASWMMALTFGLFHIVYAVAVWAMGEKETRAAEPGEAEHV